MGVGSRITGVWGPGSWESEGARAGGRGHARRTLAPRRRAPGAARSSRNDFPGARPGPRDPSHHPERLGHPHPGHRVGAERRGPASEVAVAVAVAVYRPALRRPAGDQTDGGGGFALLE